MISGIIGAISWSLETVVIGIALSKSSLCGVFLAPFVSTFIHDTFSAIFVSLYNLFRGNIKNVWKALMHTKTGKYVIVGALIGGPIGMTGYVLCVNYLGASIGAVASAIYPAIGSVLAFIFLKEEMPWYRWVLLIITLMGVYLLSYSPQLNIRDFWIGIIGVLMCSFGWGIEAVILAKCMQDPEMKDEYALQIRQIISAIINGCVVLPIVGGCKFTMHLVMNDAEWILPTIALAALFATISYLFYYKAIYKIGASKAMALNVTYTAWSIFFTVVLLRDMSVLSPLVIVCAIVVIVCGILSTLDFKKL